MLATGRSLLQTPGFCVLLIARFKRISRDCASQYPDLRKKGLPDNVLDFGNKARFLDWLAARPILVERERNALGVNGDNI